MENYSGSIMQQELNSDEFLLWEGRGNHRKVKTKGAGFIRLFGIFWTGFAVFFMGTAYQVGAPIIFLIFPSTFVITGLYIIFYVSRYTKLQAKRSVYAITDKRVIIKSGKRTIKTTSMPLSNLSDASKSERMDGFGDILFNNSINVFPTHQHRNNMYISNIQKGFYGIENVSYVYRTLMDAISNEKE